MPTFRGILLDVDGTLVDSNDAHANAWIEALLQYGYRVSFETIRPLIGMGADNLLPRLTGLGQDDPLVNEISRRRGEIFKTKYLPYLEPLPGAHELVSKLQADGYQLVVANSAENDEVHALLHIAGVDRLVDRITTRSDVKNSKPDSDVVGVALKKGSLQPSAAVMLGDTPYDIQAATKLSVITIALRSGGWSDYHLSGAAAIYNDPADLLAHYQGSPLVRATAGRSA